MGKKHGKKLLDVIERLPDTYRPAAQLLYGSGQRPMECLRLRVGDLILNVALGLSLSKSKPALERHCCGRQERLREELVPTRGAQRRHNLRHCSGYSTLLRAPSIKAAQASAVIERLKEVFGLCGTGWRHGHSLFEEVQTDTGRVEIVAEVAFQYRFPVTTDGTGCALAAWDAQACGWAFRGETGGWSEPILACVGKAPGKGGVAITDARKSAVTDGLTKAASMIGVGHEVFNRQCCSALKPAAAGDTGSPRPGEQSRSVRFPPGPQSYAPA